MPSAHSHPSLAPKLTRALKDKQAMLRYRFAICLVRYNKAAGRVHRPLQPPGHGPHRCQVQPGLSMTCGHQAKRSDVYDEQSTVAKGSYYNPLAADMAEWGIWFQVCYGSYLALRYGLFRYGLFASWRFMPKLSLSGRLGQSSLYTGWGTAPFRIKYCLNLNRMCV